MSARERGCWGGARTVRAARAGPAPARCHAAWARTPCHAARAMCRPSPAPDRARSVDLPHLQRADPRERLLRELAIRDDEDLEVIGAEVRLQHPAHVGIGDG